jgi:2-phospho-L-lactate transferase/gluconeogenesis factor (CofD/UPF0052 family)
VKPFIYDHAGGNLFDYVVVNTRPIGASLRRKYLAEQARPVEIDLERLEQIGVKIIARDLLQEAKTVRHNPEMIAAIAVELAREGRRRRLEKQETSGRLTE